jgi:hypothetical protein
MTIVIRMVGLPQANNERSSLYKSKRKRPCPVLFVFPLLCPCRGTPLLCPVLRTTCKDQVSQDSPQEPRWQQSSSANILKGLSIPERIRVSTMWPPHTSNLFPLWVLLLRNMEVLDTVLHWQDRWSHGCPARKLKYTPHYPPVPVQPPWSAPGWRAWHLFSLEVRWPSTGNWIAVSPRKIHGEGVWTPGVLSPGHFFDPKSRATRLATLVAAIMWFQFISKQSRGSF